MDKEIWIGLYILLGIYILYRLFSRKQKPADDYQRMYNEILTSDKYKVKGQYGK